MTNAVFVHHLTNTGVKNIFVAVLWKDPTFVLDLIITQMKMVIWSEYAFLVMILEVLYKLEIFISCHLVVFVIFYKFVMNKLFYS